MVAGSNPKLWQLRLTLGIDFAGTTKTFQHRATGIGAIVNVQSALLDWRSTSGNRDERRDPETREDLNG